MKDIEWKKNNFTKYGIARLRKRVEKGETGKCVKII